MPLGVPGEGGYWSSLSGGCYAGEKRTNRRADSCGAARTRPSGNASLLPGWRTSRRRLPGNGLERRRVPSDQDCSQATLSCTFTARAIEAHPSELPGRSGALKGSGDRPERFAGTTADDVENAVHEGKPGGMPAFRNLKDQDIRNLAAYIKSLRTPAEPSFAHWWEPVLSQ